MSHVDDETQPIGNIRSRVAFFEKAFSTTTLAAETANKANAHGTPTQGIVKQTIQRLTSPKRAREVENRDPQATDHVSPGKVKISVQLFSTTQAAAADEAVQPSAKKRRIESGEANIQEEDEQLVEESVAASPFALKAEDEEFGEEFFPDDSHESFPKEQSFNASAINADPNLSAVLEKDDDVPGKVTEEALLVPEDADKNVAAAAPPETPGAGTRKRKALPDDFNKLCIRINVEPTDQDDESYSLKFKLRVVLSGLRRNLKRSTYAIPAEEGWEGVPGEIKNCFSGNDVVLWLTFHALEVFKEREKVASSVPVSDRLSSLAHSTALLIAERLIGLDVIKQVNDPECTSEPLAQLMNEESVFRFAAWAEKSKTPSVTPRKPNLVATAGDWADKEGFADALSPGGSKKGTPCSEVHLGRRSMVPATRSGRKRKQEEDELVNVADA